MSTGIRRRTGASRNQDDELKAFSEEEEEELGRRPEVTIINNYAVVVAYIRIGLKGIGALALLWATVVLLGAFISELKGEDFRAVTIIAFLQAAGNGEILG